MEGLEEGEEGGGSGCVDGLLHARNSGKQEDLSVETKGSYPLQLQDLRTTKTLGT